jgi:DNA-binding SARP family transcriptional activator
METAVIRIELLGRARVTPPHQAPRPLERKAAALVTYLALEGPTERSRLASLLWPDTSERTARGNLRQLLRRLRLTLGEYSLEGNDPIWLCDGLLIDVILLRRMFEGREHDRPETFGRQLLAGFTYDDCSELEEWLRIQRTQFHHGQCRLVEEEAVRLERAGRVEDALDAARRWLHLEQNSEQAWRLVIRLHLRRGDRAAALQAYRDCQTRLQSELSLEPSPETRALVEELERQVAAERPRLPAPMTEVGLPHLAPPELVGREQEWAALEEAWATGQPLYVFGEGGIGKTRLVAEFCSAQGSWHLLSARPTDPPTPYATAARVARVLLGGLSGRPLDGWVQQEVARLVPELSPQALPLPSTPEEKARLAEAFARLVRISCEGMDALVFDNAHRADAGSLELLMRVQDLLEPPPGAEPLRLFTCLRPGEMPLGIMERIHQQVDSGLTRVLQVGPLSTRVLGELLTSMGYPQLAPAAPTLMRYTGGNPLFLVEVVWHLAAAGRLAEPLPDVLPLPNRVHWMLEQQLKQLSPDALRFARIVALADARFSLELAACVLGVPPDQLATPWKELERAEVLHGTAFDYEFLRRFVIDTLPLPIREAVLRRIADCLRRGCH